MRAFGLLLLAGAATAAAAAEPSSSAATSSAVSAIADCRKERDDRTRLACFDKAAAALPAGGEQLVVIDREEVRQTRRSLFGFTVPKRPFFRGDTSQNEEPAQVDAVIQAIKSEGNGKYSFTMEGGAVWRTTEAFIDSPKIGDKARIKRGLIGSYIMRIGLGHPVRVMRVG